MVSEPGRTSVSEKVGNVQLVDLIGKVVEGVDLTAAESEAAFDRFMDGSASEVEMAGLLTGLRTKGANHTEIAGGVRALRKAMVSVRSSDPGRLVDTAGTGGGVVTTFNISTAAALVAAGAGIPIAKHGNRSFTSRSGSADVLEALGVDINLTPERMAEILEEEGIVFMFAPLLHPAMRYVGPVRRELGITTIMNILGPLTNPAGALRQVMGVADPRLRGLVARALQEIGHLRALVVHGDPGMDEISPSGVTYISELSDSGIVEYEVTPELLGLEPATLESLAGGDPEYNASVIQSVLAGHEGGARTAVLLNAAAAITVGGQSASLQEGVSLATSSIDSGAAAAALERLRTASNV
ncbi:MAG TPA: anthranilate phosphoribosyltransferase [Gemmatimonadetes bacterium]|jgi:anthranilate phosphoribosyltransferase|nr:anthranilate phosphoribosyltransferase [Gemmatimonadota bacterium]